MADLSGLPRVDDVLADASVRAFVDALGRPVVLAEVRVAVDLARQRALDGGAVATIDDIVRAVISSCDARQRQALQHVVNATGVLLHTNLGRAPLSDDAVAAVRSVAGASNLEFDLSVGSRGSRTAHVGDLVATLFDTPAATVVNNGAAALMLTLAALAADTATIVSRGELIEIGGSYRLPDVIAATGTRMVEVGTTNRTHVRDYTTAVVHGPARPVVLKVHPSNYVVEGFTEGVSVAELRTICDEHGGVLVVDLGSGLLTDHDGPFADEPSVAAAVRDGADLVLCSGDKLLGGPQAGIIAGREDLVERCRRHPLARAVRIDKLQRAALEATLAAHLRDPGGLTPSLPLGAMLAATTAELTSRAEALAADLDGRARVAALDSVVGGGSVPTRRLPSAGLELEDADGSLTAALRDHGVVARLHDGVCRLDLRTVHTPSDQEHLRNALRRVLT